MYIVSSFRGGCATVKSNIFFVIVFESQKPPHLNGKWGGERKRGPFFDFILHSRAVRKLESRRDKLTAEHLCDRCEFRIAKSASF